MTIDDITIRDAKRIAQIFGGQSEQKSPHIGKNVIVRGYGSGVHFGELVSKSGREVELRQSRRLWRWDAKETGISLSEVANHGGADGRQKFCEVLESISILDAIEIIPCTEQAVASIRAQPVAKS